MTTKKGFEIRNRLRKVYPYGLMKTDDGKVVFFNREYEVMNIGGQQEFDLDVDSVDIDWDHVREGIFLMSEKGDVYVGTTCFLYGSVYDPFYYDKKEMATYLQRLSKVLEVLVTPIGNAFANHTYTEEQEKIANERLRELKILLQASCALGIP